MDLSNFITPRTKPFHTGASILRLAQFLYKKLWINLVLRYAHPDCYIVLILCSQADLVTFAHFLFIGG